MIMAVAYSVRQEQELLGRGHAAAQATEADRDGVRDVMYQSATQVLTTDSS